MFEFDVRCRDGCYHVRIGKGLFAAGLPGPTDVIVADRYFAPLLAGGNIPVVFVDAVEENKTLGYAESLIVGCFEAGARRGSHILAVGGGVVQDLTTLIASLYMRGVTWSYVPTTLMAMADSCLGGKSSINAGRAKNLVGNIYPPREILVDPAFLATLPEEDVVAGLSEAVKICYCRGPAAFGAYLDHFGRFSVDSSEAAALLSHVLEAKRWFIEVDEFDQKERRFLNFGHTFGHAIESATSFAVNHGVAVAVGMLCALRLTQRQGPFDPHGSRLADHCRALLGRVPFLGDGLDGIDMDAFERAFRSDKKHVGGDFRLILPAPDGGVHEVALAATPAQMAAVAKALTSTVSELR